VAAYLLLVYQLLINCPSIVAILDRLLASRGGSRPHLRQPQL